VNQLTLLKNLFVFYQPRVGPLKNLRQAVESKTKWIQQTVEELTLGYYVDLRFVGIEWG